MIDAMVAALRFATPVPEDFDPNSVTPGWVGFTAMFLVAIATVLLLIDMVRRVRRTRYRGEIQERLEAERQAADLLGSAGGEPKPEPGD